MPNIKSVASTLAMALLDAERTPEARGRLLNEAIDQLGGDGHNLQLLGYVVGTLLDYAQIMTDVVMKHPEIHQEVLAAVHELIKAFEDNTDRQFLDIIAQLLDDKDGI